jgi:hypothetical protein
MSNLLKKINKAGLIEKLDGNDERFIKIEETAKNVAAKLREDPPLMIRAVLAGLDPDISADDPAIALATDELSDVWASVRSVHTDPPIFIYRSILLDACNHVAEGVNAVILWYTAADALPLVRLGREEEIIRGVLIEWARTAEAFSLIVATPAIFKRAPVTKKIELLGYEEVAKLTVTRAALLKRVAAACGPNNKQGEALPDSTPHWPNSAQAWCYEFTERMSELLGDHFDTIYSNLSKAQNSLIDQLKEHEEHQIKSVKDLLSTQRSWLQEIVNQNEESKKTEHLRLNTLWWCEALYSTSLCCGYREIDPIVAAIIMPLDLLNEVHTPTPASVTYVLAEAVAKLPHAEFEKRYNLNELIRKLIEERLSLPEVWAQEINSPPKVGRLSLRDMIIAVLHGEKDIDQLMQRAGLEKEFSISLPQLAQAIYRQEQAVMLAGVEQ